MFIIKVVISRKVVCFIKLILTVVLLKTKGGAYGDWPSFMKDQCRLPFFGQKKKKSHSLAKNFPWASL